MIKRPHRSVTRFFIPMIDVLILLFCIFLLMPFVSQGSNPSDDPETAETKETDAVETLPKDVETLRRELASTQRDLKQLQVQQGDLADRLSIKILEVELATGHLISYANNERIEIANEKEAEQLIDRHIRSSGGRETLFLILLPKRGAPLQKQMDDYRRWFARVPYSFDEAVAPRSSREKS